MKILTTDNTPYELDHVPEFVEDLRYCALDCSDKHNVDFYFLPLVFLESFYCPSIVLEIGPYKTQMPMDWSILVSDETFSDMEIVPLTSINDRGFHALVFNPYTDTVPSSYEIIITNVYADVKWYFPKLKNNNILVVPLEDVPNPKCVLFIRDHTKLSEIVNLCEIF
jgi:hypothetical protein